MTNSPGEVRYRALPSADRVLRSPRVAELLSRYRRESVAGLVREILGEARSTVKAGNEAATLDQIVLAVVDRAEANWRDPLIPVINATGVILHTNLGRAPLSAAALEAMRAASGYFDLELDLQTGKRGSRQQRVGALLRSLTGAESCHVTVSNASAVLLALSALAKGGEVIVSRGQAVEIGGGFRIPVILRQSGARLLEVGTTNRTQLADYEEAINQRTAAILHVHSSNFRVVGFTERPMIGELAELAHRHGLILIDDNGSGSLLETSDFGLAHEPMPEESLAAGTDIVAFSGDKLLGGPQSGLLVGSADLMQRIAKHPLARAVRPDKVTLAALAATLLAYIRGDALKTLPVWRMISESQSDVDRRAREWARRASNAGLTVQLAPGESTVGGGSLPGETLPTTLIALPSSVTAQALRTAPNAVMARTERGRVLLDLRTVSPDEEEGLLNTVIRSEASLAATKSE